MSIFLFIPYISTTLISVVHGSDKITKGVLIPLLTLSYCVYTYLVLIDYNMSFDIIHVLYFIPAILCSVFWWFRLRSSDEAIPELNYRHTPTKENLKDAVKAYQWDILFLSIISTLCIIFSNISIFWIILSILINILPWAIIPILNLIKYESKIGQKLALKEISKMDDEFLNSIDDPKTKIMQGMITGKFHGKYNRRVTEFLSTLIISSIPVILTLHSTIELLIYIYK